MASKSIQRVQANDLAWLVCDWSRDINTALKHRDAIVFLPFNKLALVQMLNSLGLNFQFDRVCANNTLTLSILTSRSCENVAMNKKKNPSTTKTSLNYLIIVDAHICEYNERKEQQEWNTTISCKCSSDFSKSFQSQIKSECIRCCLSSFMTLHPI